MKIAKLILASAIAVASVSAAHADSTTYITGATAYRSPAVSSIIAFFTPGSIQGIYGDNGGSVSSPQSATYCAFRGTPVNFPGLGSVTIVCAWGGSVGGIKLIQTGTTFNVNDQVGVKGWIPVGNSVSPDPTKDALASVTPGTIFKGAETATTITSQDAVAYTFETGASAAKPDAAFSDAFQSSALAGAAGTAIPLGPDATNGVIGVIPFDIVVSNGVTPNSVVGLSGVTYGAGVSVINYTGVTLGTLANGKIIAGTGIPLGTTITGFTGTTVSISNPTTSANQGSPAATSLSAADGVEAPFNNITSNQMDDILINAGRLPMFTGNSADAGVAVYNYARNADSGTRISWLGESYRGITNKPSTDLQPTFNPAGTGSGAGGSPQKLVSGLAKWPLENFPILGGVQPAGTSGYSSGGTLAAALTSSGSQIVTPTGFTRPGWVVGYLGRSDSSTACAKVNGQNTAKRLTFNGEQDWVGAGNANNVDGTPIGGFNDDAVRQGRYQAWEFEHFYRNSAAASDDQTVLTDLATSIRNAAAVSGTIQFSTMAVTKGVEGGVISYP